MEHYDTIFFCGEGNHPKVHLLPASKSASPWPISVTLRSTRSQDGMVTFYLHNESDLIGFKNSVLEAYNEYRRRMGYDK